MRPLLTRTLRLAEDFLDGLDQRPVGASAGAAALRRDLGGPLPATPEEASAVVEALARGADRGLVASAGPRYFGFVTGGSLPAALAADWLASAWDQNTAMFVQSPAAAVIEETAAAWILEALDLPRSAGVGLLTGATMASFTCLAAARHQLLRRLGWDVEEDGLRGAPAVHVVAGAEAHTSVLGALRMLGFGSRAVKRVETDAQGRMRVDRLASVLERCDAPVLLCVQVGNVNTGASDPMEEIVALARRHGAWVHVDGAFGLWAAASPRLRRQVAGVEGADSWATDGHKWLNVPYDCGIAIVAHPEAQRAAMTLGAAYLVSGADDERDNGAWSPELSRRARGIPLYAALRSLGRQGLAELIERCCRHASLMAELLRRSPRVRILNDVVLNQVLVRFEPGGGGDADEFTRQVVRRVQQEGTCWAGGTVWHDLAAMRISFSSWATSDADVERSAAAILAAAA